MATFNTAAKTLVIRRTFDQIFTPEEKTTISTNTISVPAIRTNPTRALTVYSGIQPTAQIVEASWTSYNSNNSICLAHYNSSAAPVFYYNSGTLTYFFTNTSGAITTTALNSGTATWAIIWMTDNADISLTSIPASGKFVVVPVTTTGGVGVIRYTNTTATQGSAFAPYDGGITLVEA